MSYTSFITELLLDCTIIYTVIMTSYFSTFPLLIHTLFSLSLIQAHLNYVYNSNTIVSHTLLLVHTAIHLADFLGLSIYLTYHLLILIHSLCKGQYLTHYIHSHIQFLSLSFSNPHTPLPFTLNVSLPHDDCLSLSLSLSHTHTHTNTHIERERERGYLYLFCC